MFERLYSLIGDKIETIKNKTVAIIGLGGVGGYAMEILIRSGIENIIIIDNDTVDMSNLNRQIISHQQNIGKLKVDEWEKRAKLINPSINIKKYPIFLTEQNLSDYLSKSIDYIIDACDTLNTKKAIIKYCCDNNIKLISSMGTGNKIDPTRLKITNLEKTKYDPIAKILRQFVRKENIKANIPVVFSDEQKYTTISKPIPSNAFVPATAGILLASYVINDIIKVNYE